MTTAIRTTRSGILAGAAATLALAAIGFAGAAQARDNVAFSLGIGVPGGLVGVSNAYPVYAQPQVVYAQPQVVYAQPQVVYAQPRPVYVQPAPVYYQPAPVYYSGAPVYVAPQPVYYGRRHGHRHHDGYYVQAPRAGYGPAYGHGKGNGPGNGLSYGPGYGRGYAPVYYQR